MIRLLSCLLSLALCPVALAGNYGDPVPLGKPLPLAQAMASDPPAEGRLLFSGRITEVCQNKGCWAMLEDNGQAVRLTMHQHAFSIPKDYRGRSVVWGQLKRVELSPELAKHLAEDAGRAEPDALVEYRIDTLGLKLLDEEGGNAP